MPVDERNRIQYCPLRSHAGANYQDDLSVYRQQHPAFARCEQRRGIHYYQPPRIGGGEAGGDLTHARAGEELGGVLDGFARR